MNNITTTDVPDPTPPIPVTPTQSALKAVLIVMLFLLTWLSSMVGSEALLIINRYFY